MWNTFVHANFYSDVKKFIENMSWIGIANLDEKCYSPMLVNEFYSGLLLRSDEYENPPRFNPEVLYTFINGYERIITKSNLGKLIGCEFYGDVFEVPRHYLEVPRHYQTDNVWDTMAREPGCKKVASNVCIILLLSRFSVGHGFLQG